MTQTRGRPSLHAPKNSEVRESRGLLALIALGVLVSAGLLVVSALLNFRMGYRSADTELDGWIYGTGAALGDGLKAICPFMAYVASGKKDRLGQAAAWLIFAVMTAYSFTAAVGFAAEHRANKTAITQGSISDQRNWENAYRHVTARMQELQPQPAPSVVNAELEALYRQPAYQGGKTVGELSASCTLARKVTRDACARATVMKERLAKAEEWASLTAREGALRLERKDHATEGAHSVADPQGEALRRIAAPFFPATTVTDVAFGLAILLALFVELGSGLGLYVATTPLRERRPPSTGEVTAYATARLMPEEGDELTITEIYADYVNWCVRQRHAALSREAFGQAFRPVASRIGLRHLLRNRREVYQDVRFDTDD